MPLFLQLRFKCILKCVSETTDGTLNKNIKSFWDMEIIRVNKTKSTICRLPRNST